MLRYGMLYGIKIKYYYTNCKNILKTATKFVHGETATYQMQIA